VRTRIEKAATLAGRDPREIELIVVTKNFPVSDAEILYEIGVRSMGENRDSEGAGKAAVLSDRADLTWHFQGQIQSRKIPSIASWAKVVHSLDEISHANKFAQQPRIPELFLQVNFEPERSDRGGVAPAELSTFIEQLPEAIALRLTGLMCVAPIDQEPSKVFSELANLRKELASQHPQFTHLTHLSMGMSNDFEAAIAHGATQIRVGSSILGSRPPLT
jgi:hypothetical protein